MKVELADLLALPGVAAGGIPITTTDFLFVRVLTRTTTFTVRVRGLVMESPDSFSPIELITTAPTQGEFTEFTTSLQEGILVGLTAQSDAGTPDRGELYVVVGIRRGRDNIETAYRILIQDYLTDENLLGWPGSALRDMREGPGALKVITITDPAAGADFTDTVPNNLNRRLLSTSFQFVASAEVSNRRVKLIIEDGNADILYEIGTSSAQTADQNIQYTFAPHLNFDISAQANVATLGAPDIWLPEDFTVRSEIDNIQSGDQISNIRLYVEEWATVRG